MDKEYTNQELESKKLNELKDIAKNLRLKISGNKNELIERILNSQITYFDILPKDISNIVEEYKIKNNPNNQFLVYYFQLLEYLVIIKDDGKISDDIRNDMYKVAGHLKASNLNTFFEDNKLNIKFKYEIRTYPTYELEMIKDVKIGKLPLINDELMAKILLELVKNHQYMDRLNALLFEWKLPFLLSELNFNEVGRSNMKLIMYNGKIIY